MVKQPREAKIGEPTSWRRRKATSSVLYGLAPGIPRGDSPGHVHIGVRPGTWESPEISASQSRVGSGRPKVQASSRGRTVVWRSECTAALAVPPSEGNEAKRDGLRVS